MSRDIDGTLQLDFKKYMLVTYSLRPYKQSPTNFL